MVLENKAVIVTGGSRGLGKEIVKQCLMNGALVAFCGRDQSAVDAAYEQLQPYAGPAGRLYGCAADVSCAKSAAEFVRFAAKKLGGIDILINNAGIHGAKKRVDAVDFDLDEWTSAVRVNLIGTLNMCRYALPHLKKSARGKIINLSGGGATSPMPGMSAYAASKAAVVRFSETLAMELQDAEIDVNAVAPGAMNTRLLDDVLVHGKGQVSDEYYAKLLAQQETGGTPLSKAASLCVYLASDSSNGVTGKLISAVWDNWSELHTELAKLPSDVYTLRRIVPEDRK